MKSIYQLISTEQEMIIPTRPQMNCVRSLEEREKAIAIGVFPLRETPKNERKMWETTQQGKGNL